MKNRICNGLPQASKLVVSMKSENGKKPVALLLVCSADLREAIDSGICQIYYRLLRVQYTMHRIQRLQILSFVSFCSCRLSLLLASKILVFQFFLIGEYDRQDVFFCRNSDETSVVWMKWEFFPNYISRLRESSCTQLNRRKIAVVKTSLFYDSSLFVHREKFSHKTRWPSRWRPVLSHSSSLIIALRTPTSFFRNQPFPLGNQFQ